MRFGPVHLLLLLLHRRRPAGRVSRARNYSQFRVNESKTIRIAAQTRAKEERERKRRGNTKSGVKRERSETKRSTREETRGRAHESNVREREMYREKEGERERSRRTFILRYPGRCPLSVFSPLATPVDSILEARRALPRAPRGPQAGFLNFVTFKFKHSHLLRSPPPQCLCAFCQCRSCPFSLTGRSSFSRSFPVFLPLPSYSIARLLRPSVRFIIRMRARLSPRERILFSATQ